MSGSFTVQYIFRMIDRFSGPSRQLARSAQAMSKPVHAAGAAANASAASIARMGAAANTASTSVGRLAARMRALRTVRHGLHSPFSMGGGVGGGLSLFAVGNTLFNFEDKMNEVQALMSASDESMKLLRAKVIEVGAKSRYTATQVAGGLVELARAGVYDPKLANVLIDATTGLSEATNTPMNRAADIATNIAKSFGQDITEANMREMVDALAQGTRRTNFNLGEVAESMKYTAAAANKYGLSMKDTTAVIMTLAQRGIKGSTAGTGLARVIEGSIAPAKPALKALKAIGIDSKKFFDKNGNFQLFDMIEKFREAEKKFGKVKVGAALYKTFGKRGGRIMENLVTDKSIEDMAQFRQFMADADGAVEQMRKTRMKGLPGGWYRLVAAAEHFVLQMGDKGGLTATLDAITGKLKSFMDTLSAMDPAWLSIISHAAMAAAAISMLVIPLGVLAIALRALGIGAAVRGIGMLLGVLGRVGLGIATGIAAGAASIGRMIGHAYRFAGALGAAKVAARMLGRALTFVFVVQGATWIYENWSKIRAAYEDPINIRINWPELPESIKSLIEWTGRNNAAFDAQIAEGTRQNQEWLRGWMDYFKGDNAQASVPNGAAVTSSEAQKELSVRTTLDPITITTPPSVKVDVNVRGQINGQVTGTGSGTLPIGAQAPRGKSTAAPAAAPSP